MTKIKAMLAAAAAMVGAVALGVALNQAGVEVGMSPQEWCRAAARANNDGAKRHFFVAVAVGAEVPVVSGGRVLGECSGGTCTVTPDATPHCSVEYTYDCGPAVNGWRVCDVWAPPYFAKGWKLEAAGNPDFRWYGGLGQVVDDCREHFTGAQCLELLQADKKCWKLTDGRLCRYGSLLDGAPCPYALVASRWLCVSYNGASGPELEASNEWTDEELDEL